MSSSVYFRNLNALRFIGAFMVIIHHLEQFKSLYNHPHAFGNTITHSLGKVGVILFFVLSGFLITYLLLQERKLNGSVNIKAFYLRRVFRIWPLYYLIVISAFFIFPFVPLFQVPGMAPSLSHESFLPQLLFTILLLPNFAAMYGAIPGANQLWSIGVEEQFYLFWPHLFRWKNKIVCFLICGYLAFVYVILPLLPGVRVVYWTITIVNKLNITNMAIGGLFAIIFFDKNEMLLKILYHKLVQVGAIIASIALLPVGLTPFNYAIYPVILGIVILNLATNPKTIVNLENKVTNYLGQISYGLYMYHSLIIIITLNILSMIGVYHPVLVYSMAIFLTVIVSDVSYRYFEQRFMRLKAKYSVVQSGALENNKKQYGIFKLLKKPDAKVAT
ncbi:MAG: acyltransferase [Sphingobacteriales bacterium]|nr:MAG: acyltransferase [Sphingobacteriales bacterium]